MLLVWTSLYVQATSTESEKTVKRINPSGGHKYLVVKIEDIDQHLTPEEKISLEQLCAKIELGRFLNGRPHNSYLVVNVDEPYSFVVSELIAESEALKHLSEKGKTSATRPTRDTSRRKKRKI